MHNHVYLILANCVFCFHILWVGLLVSGPLLGSKWPAFRLINFTVVAVTVTSQLIWLGCPLVALESALRHKYDPSYEFGGSFICACISKWFGVTVSPWVITAQLAIVAIIAAVMVVKVPKPTLERARVLGGSH